MLRYGYGQQDSTRRQLSCRVRPGNGPKIESARHAHTRRRATIATAGFIPLSEQEAALVRMLALGHSLEAIVDRVGSEPAAIVEALRELAARVTTR